MRFFAKKLVFAAIFAVCAAAGVAAWSAGAISDNSGETICIFPEDLKWGGNAGLHGLQTAPLVGDSRGCEPYAERIKIPDGVRLKPHWHPNQGRMVTVISGTLRFAFGDKFDETKLKALPPGTFFTEPKNMAHYAVAKGEVILQLSAIGPAGTNYVESTATEKK
jgi:uncharacterized RmlC-like cupin family protein